jgi:hypothetical protein
VTAVLALGALAFANPWMLTALMGLPVLWLLLRITPPAPRVQRFPAIRLLYRLQSTEETPDSAPWWLLLLRLLIAALVIFAVAHPIRNAGDDLPGGGAVVIVVDDDWAAARDWSSRIKVMGSLVDQADRDDRPIFLFRTTWTPDDERDLSKPLTATAARSVIKAMAPRPRPSTLGSLRQAVETAPPPSPADIVWLSNGILDPGETELMETLRRLGRLTIVADNSGGPKILVPPSSSGRAIAVEAARVSTGAVEPIIIRAIASDGRVLAHATGAFAASEKSTSIEISLPVELRNDIGRLEIEGEATAGAVVLLDDAFKRRPVGLVSATAFDGKQPLLDELHYLERALSPFSEVTRGRLSALLRGGSSALILADIGVVQRDDRKQLSDWIGAGGVLIRFAGPRLAAAGLDAKGLGTDDLVPTRLRGGDRALGGALSWSRPQAVSIFSPDGPFVEMDSYGGVLVRRQVLAEPSIDLDQRTWARLADGTPIVTARRVGKGWLVLFHTTANPEWSDLALSGLFVDMLSRVVGLGAGLAASKEAKDLPPLATLDGFGVLGTPPASARGLAVGNTETSPVGPNQPPGYYGNQSSRRALNLSIAPEQLVPQNAPPRGVASREYTSGEEIDFRPFLLSAALILFLIDLFITLIMRGVMTPRGMAARSMGNGLMIVTLLAGMTVAPELARAQGQERAADAFALNSTLETRLAYVVTGNDSIDSVSNSGLTGLTEVLIRRTAIEPAEPVGVDLETDELAFFSLLYWPIAPNQAPLSGEAVKRVNAFMRNGGTVLFDTRDQFEGGLSGGGAGMRRLRALSRDLDIPPLMPVPLNHVLTKAFYLLNDFPGRFTGGQVWIQDQQDGTSNEVTPVIIGSHDWSGAWARDHTGRFALPVIPGGEMQREMAFRFGVNLMMYALTGNYKADQVHVPSILERLGQ